MGVLNNNNILVFCTSCFSIDRQRYMDWIGYYRKFFANEGVDFLIVNDGPVPNEFIIDADHIISFGEMLGRTTIPIFQGWKRSFHSAISWAKHNNYNRIIHIESDCFILESAKGELIEFINSKGYFTGFSRGYNFPETALQIINDQAISDYFIERYSNRDSWYEDTNFEIDVVAPLTPQFILNGERSENIKDEFEEYSYFCNTSYSQFVNKYTGYII